MVKGLEGKAVKPTLRGIFIRQHIIFAPVSLAVITAGAVILVSFPGMGSLPGFALVIAGCLALAATILHSKMRRDATSISFDDDKLVYETGILEHRKKKIPINQITDSSVTRTLAERLIKTGTFNVNTSGSSGYELVCEGIDSKELEQLHASLYAKIKMSKDRPGEGSRG